MNAAMLLARAKAAGVTVNADGNRLRLTSTTPAPTALMHDLAGAKAELLALLECQSETPAECTTHAPARNQRKPDTRLML